MSNGSEDVGRKRARMLDEEMVERTPGLGAQRPVDERPPHMSVDEWNRLWMSRSHFTETDLRALALEHAVATRGPDDKGSGSSVVERAEKFLSFLRGVTDDRATEGGG